MNEIQIHFLFGKKKCFWFDICIIEKVLKETIQTNLLQSYSIKIAVVWTKKKKLWM